MRTECTGAVMSVPRIIPLHPRGRNPASAAIPPKNGHRPRYSSETTVGVSDSVAWNKSSICVCANRIKRRVY